VTWQRTLDEAENRLATCRKNAQHRYSKHLRQCPWCERTTLFQGADPFPSKQEVRTGAQLDRTPLKQKPLPSAQSQPLPAASLSLPANPKPSKKVKIVPLLPTPAPAANQDRFRFGIKQCLWLVALWVALAAGGKLLPEQRPRLPGPELRTALNQTRVNPVDGAVMVWVPPGPFMMGDGDHADNPRHKVNLTGYWIYKYPVTVAQYQRFCVRTGRDMPPVPEFDRLWFKKEHPIVNVSWNDAQDYCRYAGVSLPTEAQWEKAARGPRGTLFPWGNTFDNTRLWCPVGTSKVISTAPVVRSSRVWQNGYGCVDMAGNVLQWCQDKYDEAFWLNAQKGENPANIGSGDLRVLRGGGANTFAPEAFRSARRYKTQPESRTNVFGFRCSVDGS
jgi:formylglycine-generating enzyme required for sulfatase activity